MTPKPEVRLVLDVSKDKIQRFLVSANPCGTPHTARATATLEKRTKQFLTRVDRELNGGGFDLDTAVLKGSEEQDE